MFSDIYLFSTLDIKIAMMGQSEKSSRKISWNAVAYYKEAYLKTETKIYNIYFFIYFFTQLVVFYFQKN